MHGTQSIKITIVIQRGTVLAIEGIIKWSANK